MKITRHQLRRVIRESIDPQAEKIARLIASDNGPQAMELMLMLPDITPESVAQSLYNKWTDIITSLVKVRWDYKQRIGSDRSLTKEDRFGVLKPAIDEMNALYDEGSRFRDALTNSLWRMPSELALVPTDTHTWAHMSWIPERHVGEMDPQQLKHRLKDSESKAIANMSDSIREELGDMQESSND